MGETSTERATKGSGGRIVTTARTRADWNETERKTHTIFVDGLPHDVAKMTLFKVFGWAGGVVDIYVSRKKRRGSNRPFAFIVEAWDGPGEVECRDLGPFKCILTFETVEAKDIALNSPGLQSLFFELRPLWEFTRAISSRIWLEITGVPLHLWSADTFLNIGKIWGKPVMMDELTDYYISYTCGSILVDSYEWEFINEWVALDDGNRRFEVYVKEFGREIGLVRELAHFAPSLEDLEVGLIYDNGYAAGPGSIRNEPLTAKEGGAIVVWREDVGLGPRQESLTCDSDESCSFPPGYGPCISGHIHRGLYLGVMNPNQNTEGGSDTNQGSDAEGALLPMKEARTVISVCEEEGLRFMGSERKLIERNLVDIAIQHDGHVTVSKTKGKKGNAALEDLRKKNQALSCSGGKSGIK
ncbi:hypothetical protein PIB30_062593 [Stylosanthes scabra]|uniref:RRM domain-containing protein n=1 Tax=Stylosanthes scabra TaxID=79078 RepID=A0ABU6VMW7_9FABA|nr:hypothetical protein [Stylosanthes scabra]